MPIILGCDIGTTSVKVLAIDQDGSILSTIQEEYTMYHPHPDWHEQDAEEIRLATFRCINNTLATIAPLVPDAIVFSAAMHSLLVVDEHNKPVTPVMIWADNRSELQAQRLKNAPLGENIYHSTGTPIHPMSPLCKLLWIQEHSPHLLSDNYKFVGIKEYLLFHVTNQWVVDYSIASATGLFNIHTKQWDQQCLSLLSISSSQLPTPISPTAQLSPDASCTLLPPSICIIPGASDGCLSNLGAGALSNGKLALTIGTSAAVRVAIDKPSTAANKSTFCYLLDDDTYISGGGSNSGGKVFDWALTTLYPDLSVEEASDLASQTPITSLLFFPYLFGERAPLWDATVRGGFIGLDIMHTRAHMLRAVQEGILFNLLLISQEIERHHTIESIYANGGFVANKAWVQMLADIFNKPVILNETKEAAAMGAAIMGFKSLGVINNYEEATQFQSEVAKYLPNPTIHQQYKEVFTKFQYSISRIVQ